MKNKRMGPLKFQMPMANERADRQVLLSALRIGLFHLSEMHRHLLVLKFGAGLTLNEIADEFKLSRQQVMLLLQGGLKAMQDLLVQEGFGPLEVRVDANLLTEAICEGGSVPEGMGERIMSRISRIASLERQNSTNGSDGLPNRLKTPARIRRIRT